MSVSHSHSYSFFPCRTLRYNCNDTNPDTAQLYRNETEAGIAIRDSGLDRKDIFITTKYSGSDGLDVQTSIRNSLKYVSRNLNLVRRLHVQMQDSWEFPTWTYTSSMGLVSLFRIFRRSGRRWRTLKLKDLQSEYLIISLSCVP